MHVNLTGNAIGTDWLTNAIQSFAQVSALQLYLADNNVTTLGPSLIGGYFNRGLLDPPALIVDVSFNPLTSISSELFKSSGEYGNCDLDVSYPINTSMPLSFPQRFVFVNQTGQFTGLAHSATLVVRASGTGAGASMVTSLADYLRPVVCDGGSEWLTLCHGGCGPTCNLTVIARGNKISKV
jgi:hypothetical protein